MRYRSNVLLTLCLGAFHLVRTHLGRGGGGGGGVSLLYISIVYYMQKGGGWVQIEKVCKIAYVLNERPPKRIEMTMAKISGDLRSDLNLI